MLNSLSTTQPRACVHSIPHVENQCTFDIDDPKPFFQVGILGRCHDLLLQQAQVLSILSASICFLIFVAAISIGAQPPSFPI